MHKIMNVNLPHAICVTTFPMSSNTFRGLISWFVELCPSCPYPPAPNVNTPPSCKIKQGFLLIFIGKTKRKLNRQGTVVFELILFIMDDIRDPKKHRWWAVVQAISRIPVHSNVKPQNHSQWKIKFADVAV